jgi:hypothetical protein
MINDTPTTEQKQKASDSKNDRELRSDGSASAFEGTEAVVENDKSIDKGDIGKDTDTEKDDQGFHNY